MKSSLNEINLVQYIWQCISVVPVHNYITFACNIFLYYFCTVLWLDRRSTDVVYYCIVCVIQGQHRSPYVRSDIGATHSGDVSDRQDKTNNDERLLREYSMAASRLPQTTPETHTTYITRSNEKMRLPVIEMMTRINSFGLKRVNVTTRTKLTNIQHGHQDKITLILHILTPTPRGPQDT